MSSNHYADAIRLLDFASKKLSPGADPKGPAPDPIAWAQAAATAGVGKALLALLDHLALAETHKQDPAAPPS